MEAIIIGGSAGSFEAILSILERLDIEMIIPIIVVLHRPKNTESFLERQLQLVTHYTVKEVENNEFITNGYLYTVPPDYHLLLENNKSLSFDSSEKVNFSRPSIDVTYESFSEVLKEKCCGILLSGANSDGANGLLKIAQKGGLTIVQDLNEAEFDIMPKAAIELYNNHKILNCKQIINLLNHYAK